VGCIRAWERKDEKKGLEKSSKRKLEVVIVATEEDHVFPLLGKCSTSVRGN